MNGSSPVAPRLGKPNQLWLPGFGHSHLGAVNEGRDIGGIGVAVAGEAGTGFCGKDGGLKGESLDFVRDNPQGLSPEVAGPPTVVVLWVSSICEENI